MTAPEIIEKCIQEQSLKLDLGNCGLTDSDFNTGSTVDRLLRQCTHITELYLASTWKDYTDFNIDTWIESTNKGSRNKLNEIPDAIGCLTNLKTLICPTKDKDGFWCIYELGSISNLYNLVNLDISYNEIKSIGELKKLEQLRYINLSDNLIYSLSGLQNANELEFLNVDNNVLPDISGIRSLQKLKFFSANNNRIARLSGIEELLALQFVSIQSNHIIDIGLLSSLNRLEVLNMANNYISDFETIIGLGKLNTIILSENRILNVPDCSGLKGLKEIYIDRNEINDIGKLNTLSEEAIVYVGRNKIKNISETDYMRLISFPKISEKRLLKFLSLIGRKEKILKLPSQPSRIDVSEALLDLQILTNPVVSPPLEIARRGYDGVINYFNELRKQGTDFLYEAKLLIVGQPRAGKTSLRFKLFDVNKQLPVEEETTRGIDIERLSFDINNKYGESQKFYYYAWDFGGQQIYQTTHQFFLTHRSLYVLVMDTGKDSTGNDDATINYWLQAIELLGGNSPLLLIMNEKNEREISIDIAQKRNRFPFLKAEFKVNFDGLSPKDKNYSEARLAKFNLLRASIQEWLQQLPLVGFPMPRNWIQIREVLQQKSKITPYISRDEYIKICEEFGVLDYIRQMELSRIFHDLGVFLHFQDYPNLEDIVILQNVWATDAVFAVLDNDEIKKSSGKFTLSQISRIWKNKLYEEKVHLKLLALMMQFELCYKVEPDDKNIYIIPEMLPVSLKDYKWDLNNKTPIEVEDIESIAQQDLVLQYRYDFMPKGILTRLIVRLHRAIDNLNGEQVVWKSGVKINGTALGSEGTYAEVTEAWDNKCLYIRVSGIRSKELLGKISYEIDMLNNSFFNKKLYEKNIVKSRWYKLVPCSCITCKNAVDKHFYNYDELLERKSFNKDSIECAKKPYAKMYINELLANVFSEYKPSTGPKKIFISYSHNDEKWKNRMQLNLAALKNQNLILAWDDRQIEAGCWDSQIETKLHETDIFLLLITHNFLSSSYITNKEIEIAYSRYKEGKAIIFPIICDSCDWQLQPITRTEKEYHTMEEEDMYVWLGKFQAFPKDAKPIKKWSHQQDAFVDIINQLKKYL